VEPSALDQFIAGGLGALVSLRFATANDGWWKRGSTLLCGALVAGYFAQPLADWLKLAKETDILGVAFAIGLLGLSIIASIFRAIGELKVAEIVSGWISRKG
jgi:fructose-specific phosphotransferase system IIC component